MTIHLKIQLWIKIGLWRGAERTADLASVEQRYLVCVPQTKCHWAHLAGSADRQGSQDQYKPICSHCTERLSSIERATWESRAAAVTSTRGSHIIHYIPDSLGYFKGFWIGFCL